MNIDRRQFLVRAAVGASGAVSLVVLGCGNDEAAIDLRDVFGDPADAIAIGRDYLLQYPEEGVREDLIVRMIPADDIANPTRLRGALHDKIRADFAASRTFAYNHWILSRTEGRLAALAALDLG